MLMQVIQIVEVFQMYSGGTCVLSAVRSLQVYIEFVLYFDSERH